MTQVFEGRTVDADAPFLGGEFWKEGREVTGKVVKFFETTNIKNGVPVKAPAFVLFLDEPVEIDGEEWDRVSVGNLAGFKMANDVARDDKGKGLGRLQINDAVTLLCEGFKAAKKEGNNPRVNFKITVRRG